MEDWTEGLGRRLLVPYNRENPPWGSMPWDDRHCAYGQRKEEGEPLTVEWCVRSANVSLNSWKEMVRSTIADVTSIWQEKIYVTGLEVGAIFLNGEAKLDHQSMPPQYGKSSHIAKGMIADRVWDSVCRWTGTEVGQFTPSNLAFYQQDEIVEITIHFTSRTPNYYATVI